MLLCLSLLLLKMEARQETVIRQRIYVANNNTDNTDLHSKADQDQLEIDVAFFEPVKNTNFRAVFLPPTRVTANALCPKLSLARYRLSNFTELSKFRKKVP